MAQPTQADQGTLKFAIDGAPALGYYVGTPNTTGTLKFALDGAPVYAPGSAVVDTPLDPIVIFIGL